MVDPIPNLRILDRSPVTDELDLVAKLFHRINRVIPKNQVRQVVDGVD